MIVGLVGFKGVGKDTVADLLRRHHSFTPAKFAGGLKYMLRNLLRYQAVEEARIDQMLEGNLKETPVPELAMKTPRWAMESLGTEWGRVCINRDFWVGIELAAARTNLHTVFSDVRHLNEVAGVRSTGGVVWRITRQGHERTTDHSSERMIEQITCDWTIENDGSHQDLDDKVRAALRGTL